MEERPGSSLSTLCAHGSLLVQKSPRDLIMQLKKKSHLSKTNWECPLSRLVLWMMRRSEVRPQDEDVRGERFPVCTLPLLSVTSGGKASKGPSIPDP